MERFRSDCKKNRYKESAWRRRLDEWRCRRMEKQYKMEEWRYHEHKIVQHPFCAAFRYCWGFLMLPFVCTAVSFLLLHSDFGALGDNSAVIFLSHFFPVFFPLVDTVSRCLGYIHSCDSARDVVIEYGTVLFWRNSFIFRTASHLVAVAPISQVLFP